MTSDLSQVLAHLKAAEDAGVILPVEPESVSEPAPRGSRQDTGQTASQPHSARSRGTHRRSSVRETYSLPPKKRELVITLNGDPEETLEAWNNLLAMKPDHVSGFRYGNTGPTPDRGDPSKLQVRYITFTWDTP